LATFFFGVVTFDPVLTFGFTGAFVLAFTVGFGVGFEVTACDVGTPTPNKTRAIMNANALVVLLIIDLTT
jgi:hypothetical protein